MFNHESPTRDETCVTRKITRAVAAIEVGRQPTLYLGNLDATRGWGHARDYVDDMWRILQQEVSDNYVLATSEMHSVREFVERSFAVVGRTLVWIGEGVDEQGLHAKTGQMPVEIDPVYFRPTEVDQLLSGPTKAREKLG